MGRGSPDIVKDDLNDGGVPHAAGHWSRLRLPTLPLLASAMTATKRPTIPISSSEIGLSRKLNGPPISVTALGAEAAPSKLNESETNTMKPLIKPLANGTKLLKRKASDASLTRLMILDIDPEKTDESTTFRTVEKMRLAVSNMTADMSPVTTLDPVKTLETVSDSVDEVSSERFAKKTKERVTLSEIEAARFSEIEAVKKRPRITLSVIAEARFSESPRNPVKTLVTLPEGTTASERNLVAPLVMLSVIAEARSSDVLLNPVKTLMVLSERRDPRFSDKVRLPLKTLETVSESALETSIEIPLREANE